MSYKNILLIGAGGNLGLIVVEALLHSTPSFTLTILTRQSSKSTFPPTIKVIKIADDYPSADLEAAFQNQDAVISTVGGPGIAYQTRFVDAAVKAGVKRFFPSEFGSNLKNPGAVETVPIFQPKIDVVEYLRKQEGTGLTWTSVVTGPFLDWGLKSGFLGFNIPARTAEIYGGGTARWSGTNLSTVGHAMVSLLKTPSVSSNQHAYISSVTTTQNEILAILEQEAGTKYQVENISIQALLDDGKAKLAKGDYSGVPQLIKAHLYGGGEGNDFEGTVDKELGLGREDLGEVVRHVVRTGELVK